MKVVLESEQSDEKFLTDLRSAFPDVTATAICVGNFQRPILA